MNFAWSLHWCSEYGGGPVLGSMAKIATPEIAQEADSVSNEGSRFEASSRHGETNYRTFARLS